MARPHLPPAERLARQQAIGELYLEGKWQVEIAAQLGISQPTVSRELDLWQQAWERSIVQEIGKARVRELGRIDRLERVAWAAWGRSKKDIETRTASIVSGRTTKDGVPLPNLSKTIQTTRGSAGDPRFLDRIAWCIEARCRIMGILRQDGPTANCVVTVVGGIDLQVVTGQKPGIAHERIAVEAAAAN